MLMKRRLLQLLILLLPMSSLWAYTIFPDFKGRSFILGTAEGSYTIDNTVLTQKLDGIQVEQYGERIWRIDEGEHSTLMIMTENRKEIETALFTMSFLRGETTAIISPYMTLEVRDLETLAPDYLFQMEFSSELEDSLKALGSEGVTLRAGDVVEISSESAWTWSMAGEERTIRIICPECGNEIEITLAQRRPD